MANTLHYDDCNHGIDRALVRKIAWRYILRNESSYKKIGDEFGLSQNKVGHILRKELPEVSRFLFWLYNLKKDQNVKRSINTIAKKNK